MKRIEMATSPSDKDDAQTLVRSALDDIGAIFDVLADRQGTDTTGKSLCNTGRYLSDKWAQLIIAKIETIEGDRIRAPRARLTPEQATERMRHINPPRGR